MSLLDRFRNKTPPKTPRGGSGRAHYNGHLQFEELNVDLRGERGLKIFDRMYRTDPDVRRVMSMMISPIVGATWSVEPFGGDEAEQVDEDAAELVKWVFFDFIQGKLTGHLAQALPVVLRSGFAPFEEIWDTAEWNGKTVIVPKRLGLRLPRTIHRWIQNDDEDLVALEQFLPSGGLVEIPMDDLVYYRVGAEGDNWEGTSLLRAAYKPWYLKEQLEKIDVIAAEREATGVPIVYPPTGATPDQLDELEEILGGLRTNEEGFIVAPGPAAQFMKETGAGQGWHFEILSHNSSESRDLSKSLEYHRNAIAGALVADFIRLGQDGTGARATADVQQDPFLAGVEAVAGIIETALNDAVTSRIAALNFDVDEPPKLRMSLVDSTDLGELAEFTKQLIDAGALVPDVPLEDYLRDRADLPPADPAARKRHEEMQAAAAKALTDPPDPNADPNEPNEPPKPGDPKPKAKPAAKKPPPKEPQKADPDDDDPVPSWAGRELRWWEQLMNLEAIDTAINGARQRFEEVAGPETRQLASEFATAALAGKKQPRPGKVLEEAIEGELLRLYRFGRAAVLDDLDLQRSSLPVTRASDADMNRAAAKRLARRAHLAAESIIARLWQAVSRTALSRPGDMAAAQSAGEKEAAAALRAEAQLHAGGSLNEGRADEADLHSDEIRGSRYTSILDTNRCAECSSADDDVLRPLDDPIRVRHRPPNPDCYGGGRCRCMEFFELREEGPGSGGGGAPVTEPPGAPPAPGAPAGDHFNVSGGTQPLRDLVADQIAAIESVHGFPAGLPTINLAIKQMAARFLGKIRYSYDPHNRTWAYQEINLNRLALDEDPPLTSAVHEIGHFLDEWGFGDGPPHDIIVQTWNSGRTEFLSSTDAMKEWRDAVKTSRAYSQLVANGASSYEISTPELLARSYEQYIATHSRNPALLAKIAERRRVSPNLYWDVADFHAIAEAFDRFFKTRGLRE